MMVEENDRRGGQYTCKKYSNSGVFIDLSSGSKNDDSDQC